ncbi:MAG: cation-transporting P-type ATPase [Bryobacterales bacterium]
MSTTTDRVDAKQTNTPKDEWKSLSLEQVEAKLKTSPEGLTKAEAERRLTQYGYNEIAEKAANPFLKFLTYFWGPIPWMIEAAVILSALVRHWPDFFIILVLLGQTPSSDSGKNIRPGMRLLRSRPSWPFKPASFAMGLGALSLRERSCLGT